MAAPLLTRPDVIVIGAGCAGLSAAVRLAQHGRRVLVLEARSRLGGRATAFKDRATGEAVDNGQHVLLGCYTSTLTFLRAIGAESHVRMADELAVTMIDQQGRRTRLHCGHGPVPLNLLVGLLQWPALSWRDRWAAVAMGTVIRAERRGVATTLPDETVAEWLTRHGQTPRVREMLWDPLALAALNQPSEVATAGPFAQVLAEMFGTRDRRAAALVLPTVPLDEMYAAPARTFIEAHGGEVRTGVTVQVVLDERRVTVVAGADALSGVPVVAAVPWFALPALFSGDVAPLSALLTAAAATAPSPIATVNLWFDRPVMDEAFVGLPGRVMQWAFDKRAVFGGRASHLSLVSSGAAEVASWTNQALIEKALHELTAALPAVRGAQVVNATVIREPRATFSIAPGQPARPSTATAVAGLFLAGDWIATGLPATIESAVRSGHLAAEAVVARYPSSL